LYGTNNVNNCSYYCHQATGVGLDNVIGTGTATVSLDDLNGTDCIFVIGANPASNHPRFMYQLKNCRERGGQVIIINPAKEAGLVRFAVPKSAKSMMTGGTWIASEYIQPNISGDLALFKGIAKALIEQEQIDSEFIAQYTENFSVYCDDIMSTPWQTITENSGVNEIQIRALATTYAKANRAVFAWGMGITHHLQGVENVEAIANLTMLRGMLGKPSSGLLPLRGHSNVQGIGTVGVKPKLNDDTWIKLENYLGIALTRTPGMDTLACLHAADEEKIDAALFMGGNLYAATPNSTWAASALNKIPFKTYLTTTLNIGHFNGTENGDVLILPVTARDEEWQPTTQESMFNYVRLSDGGINRLTNVKPEVDILCNFATGLFTNSPINFKELKQHNAIRDLIGNTVKGMDQLKKIGTTKEEFTIPHRLLHAPVFNTPSKKASFVVNPLQQQRNTSDYPYLLSSIRSEGQFNSIIYEENDSYRGTDTRWSVLMNTEDMQEMGLQLGDKVTIESAQGEMKGLTVFAFDLPRKNIMAYYPEANVLISTQHDPRSKTPAFKSVPVKIILC
jgi:molybdopterin-dependent oxidoreductase alpha subunit